MKKIGYKLVLSLIFTLCSCSTGESSPSFSSLPSPSSSIDEPSWSDVTYIWADDKSTVTASRSLISDESNVETETVNVTRTVKLEATCTEDGIYLYTSDAFQNPAFVIQTTESPIEATGHHIGYYAIDETTHYHGCDHCDYIIGEVENHTWDEGVILTYATIVNEEIVKGDKRVTCTTCHYERIVKHTKTILEV